ncbi:alpha-galactosidase [Sansalvadorimonas sp. 2012CJ34-2]|uniref:Alpha-galactosidase n=1 Tax=Parendozoicomonas callyspongiae TaxID=2942213 RepID=A0ABT0PIC0_9GAMM|nr:glycoside hydrolase family 36 protein [Sansalvadorimonas sp. 2012CJ34-2]MCL6270502.1 alpha-galactosidase [Sansalvadorimonas sp. 2012CJ34-2]
MNKLLNHDTLNINLSVADDQHIENISLKKREEHGVLYIDFAVQAKKAITLPVTVLQVHLPFEDIHSCWTPGITGNPVSIRNKGICEWQYGFDSQICKLAPVGCFYSLTGQNKLTVALSDASEPVKMHIGAYEEERVARIQFRLFDSPSEERTSYHATLRLDLNNKPYHQAITQIAEWFEAKDEHSCMSVPEAALEPVYSTWYSFHQNLQQQEIEDQCRLAHEVGCKTIILDDGWQTDDNNRGYRFCGDWQVSQRRFPDMKAHVQRVQELGMKYMVWLSVPFIGKGCEVWDQFKDNLLFYSTKNDAGVFDPRYPKVRMYLIDTYSRMVSDYGLDGLKLDFIDEFDMNNAEGKALVPDSERDTESLHLAVHRLLSDVRRTLEDINPGILIEFRQKYIGPKIRQYGNIFRVHDCPNDSIMNRMSIMDLRMLSGNTAVHSDMFIWSPEERVESASLHFINTLFSVPQISPDMKELSEEHLAMTRHWLGFWKQHRNLLLNGKLKSSAPEMQYPIIESQLGDQKIVTLHGPVVAELFNSGENQVTLVNGALSDSLYIKVPETSTVKAAVFDCLGLETSNKTLTLECGLNEVSLPESGYIVMTR